VTVITDAQTTEVTRRRQQVDRPGLHGPSQRRMHRTATLEGVFVQIGLLPNTDWLRGTVELVARVARSRSMRAAQTSVPGRLRGGRLHDGAVQADRDRDGRGVEGGAVGLRSPDPQFVAGGGGGVGEGGVTDGLARLA
jgi:hypothetical protein